jgi:PrtD family type I secretion system ABC transporter
MTQRTPKSHPRMVLSSAKSAFVIAAAFSGLINLLMLSGPLFMLQVYDRVLPSHSVPTLIALVVLIFFLYGSQALLEALRSRLFVRLGRHIDAELAELAFDVNLRLAVLTGGGAKPGSPFKDIEQLRGFLAGGGSAAVFDLPWMPIYLAVLFGLHPWLGFLGLGGAICLWSLTIVADRATAPHQRELSARSVEATSLAEASRRNAETIIPMGMSAALSAIWRERNRSTSAAQMRASDVSSGLSGLSKFVRMTLQSMTLALGAYLVMTGKASGGVMIASSIVLGRALAPVEIAIVHWRGFVASRQAFNRVESMFAEAKGVNGPHVKLPPPSKSIVVEHVFASAPSARTAFLKDISFVLEAGDVLAVIGPSGSGKSTLARVLLGLWPPLRGTVRFDGATPDQWATANSGRWTGYLPQTVELFAGTIGDNIGRMDPDATDAEIMSAARAANIDDLIRSMDGGFNAEVGEGGHLLSGGQRQRVALARALFRDPFLTVLDEPNSSLDAEGEVALTHALGKIRARGGIAVIVAHRPAAIQAANKILVLSEGLQKAFGPRDEVLQRVLARPAPAQPAGATR